MIRICICGGCANLETSLAVRGRVEGREVGWVGKISEITLDGMQPGHPMTPHTLSREMPSDRHTRPDIELAEE